MSDPDPSPRRVRAQLLGGMAMGFVTVAALLIAPLCQTARAASLPPAPSSSARFT